MESNPASWFWVHPQWISIRALLDQPSSYLGHYHGPSVPQDSEILGPSRQGQSDGTTPLQAAHLTEQRPKSLIISSESFHLQRQCQEHGRQSLHLTFARGAHGAPSTAEAICRLLFPRAISQSSSLAILPQRKGLRLDVLRLDDNCNEIPKKMQILFSKKSYKLNPGS